MEVAGQTPKKIGLWLSEKKWKKFGGQEFKEECRKLNMKVIKLDLDQPLKEQGPFDLVLAKITPLYALAFDGNLQARQLAERFEAFLTSCPDMIVMDPLPGVHTLLHRPATYALLRAITKHDDQVTTPPYVELADTDVQTKRLELAKAGVTFPIVCKPVFGCGATSAHQMAVVLSESRLTEWSGPCVAQSFVQHGAVLYKMFVLGTTWYLNLRPSLKNFRVKDAPTVHFNSAVVSKADSSSPLTQLDQSDLADPAPQPDMDVFHRIVGAVRASLGMDLFGIDVVIDSNTGQYCIIDVNPFPSFDNIPNIRSCLAKLIHEKMNAAETCKKPPEITSTRASSSISDLLPPIETKSDGEILSRRTRDSLGIDIEKLLQSRGHLDCVSAELARCSERSSLQGVVVHSNDSAKRLSNGLSNGLTTSSLATSDDQCDDQKSSIGNCDEKSSVNSVDRHCEESVSILLSEPKSSSDRNVRSSKDLNGWTDLHTEVTRIANSMCNDIENCCSHLDGNCKRSEQCSQGKNSCVLDSSNKCSNDMKKFGTNGKQADSNPDKETDSSYSSNKKSNCITQTSRYIESQNSPTPLSNNSKLVTKDSTENNSVQNDLVDSLR